MLQLPRARESLLDVSDVLSCQSYASWANVEVELHATPGMYVSAQDSRDRGQSHHRWYAMAMDDCPTHAWRMYIKSMIAA